MFNAIIGMLYNIATKRFHPIVFREAPFPYPHEAGKPVRHKSYGHHTSGYATLEEAIQHAEGEIFEQIKQSGTIGEPRFVKKLMPWEGVEMPAMVMIFDQSEISTANSGEKWQMPAELIEQSSVNAALQH